MPSARLVTLPCADRRSPLRLICSTSRLGALGGRAQTHELRARVGVAQVGQVHDPGAQVGLPAGDGLQDADLIQLGIGVGHLFVEGVPAPVGMELHLDVSAPRPGGDRRQHVQATILSQTPAHATPASWPD